MRRFIRTFVAVALLASGLGLAEAPPAAAGPSDWCRYVPNGDACYAVTWLTGTYTGHGARIHVAASGNNNWTDGAVVRNSWLCMTSNPNSRCVNSQWLEVGAVHGGPAARFWSGGPQNAPQWFWADYRYGQGFWIHPIANAPLNVAGDVASEFAGGTAWSIWLNGSIVGWSYGLPSTGDTMQIGVEGVESQGWAVGEFYTDLYWRASWGTWYLNWPGLGPVVIDNCCPTPAWTPFGWWVNPQVSFYAGW